MEKETKNIDEKVRLDDKITIISIAPWTTGFKRITSLGEVQIQPKGRVGNLTREEVIAQAQNGNKLFTGVDGNGSHATLYIEDEWTRKEIGFDTESSEQLIINKQTVSDLFSIKSFPAFQKAVEAQIVTRAEKFYLIDMIKTLKINQYDRISFCEKHCGVKI